MVFSDAILLDGGTMLLRGVAFVLSPVVHGVLRVKRVHIVVTISLGKDRGSGNGLIFGIAVNDAGRGKGRVKRDE